MICSQSLTFLKKTTLTQSGNHQKVWFGEGKIATMVMGSWAVSQFMEQAENPDDIGYMPVPVTAADGKVYAEEGPDYSRRKCKLQESGSCKGIC